VAHAYGDFSSPSKAFEASGARLFQRRDILVGEVLERKVAPVGWPV
jgi:hypothetical protein